MTFTVKHGHRYRAQIRLGIFERVASNASIQEKFVSAGFTNVQVLGSGGERWAFGTWPEADACAELPEQVVHVAEVVP